MCSELNKYSGCLKYDTSTLCCNFELHVLSSSIVYTSTCGGPPKAAVVDKATKDGLRNEEKLGVQCTVGVKTIGTLTLSLLSFFLACDKYVIVRENMHQMVREMLVR